MNFKKYYYLKKENIEFLKTLNTRNNAYPKLKELQSTEYINTFMTRHPKNPDKKYIMKETTISLKNMDMANLTLDSNRMLRDFIKKCDYPERLICYIDVFLTRSDKNLTLNYVYEMADGDSLHSIWPNNILDVDFDLLLLIAYRLFSSLAILHENKIYHRDIKPENIIYNKKGTCYNFLKLIDFDFSCVSRNCYGSPGTHDYAALDLIIDSLNKNKDIDWEKADIISAIIVVLKLYLTIHQEDYLFYEPVYSATEGNIYKINRKVPGILGKGLLKRKSKNKGNYNIEKQIILYFLKVFTERKNIRAVDILKEMERILRGCIPKEIVHKNFATNILK